MFWPAPASRLRVRSVAAWLAGGAALLLCGVKSSAQSPQLTAPEVAPVSPPSANLGEALPMLGAELDQEQILYVLQTAPAMEFSAVGTTSLVLRTRLDAAIDGVFKPQTLTRGKGFAAELAAYRLARLLSFDNVPPSVLRRFHRDQLKAHWQGAEQLASLRGLNSLRVDRRGWVWGATIYWIPTMQSLPLEKNPWWAQWHGWLKQGGDIPDDQRSLAADLSTMIAWDYLIANWDRFSGGNTHWLASAGRLFFRDHDLAFNAPLPARLQDRLREHLQSVQRFSRAFVRQLQELQRPQLVDALRCSDLPEQASLLSPQQLDELWDRRAALLSYIGALIDSFGVEKVLAFP